MTPLPRLPANPTLPALSVTPQARPGLFKCAIAWLLIVTINISAMGQAAAKIIRGPTGAPLTGYTANGTYVQNGQVVGNPHQQLHDLVNPTLWTTAAASFTNSTDPSFTQGTLAQIEAAIAVTPEPGGLALSRLYITVPPAVPLANPYTDPNAGAAGCNAATTCNQAVYNQLLLDAQAGGYTATLDGTHIGKTHASSSPEIFNRGFNLYQTKPVFVAAENPAGGATAFFALQGEQAKTHLAHLQQQNAALLGSAIFFSQQRIRGPGTGTRTDWEGNVTDPGAAFDAALGSAPSAPSHGQYDPTPAGNGNDFVVGYIKPDGQAHEFQLQHDQHFREFQRQQNYGGWDGGSNASASELDSLLGQNLRTAGTQNLKGEQVANSIDFRGFKEDRALFMQGLDLYRFASTGERELLSRLQNGEIGPGHPQYAAARALAEDKFRGAYAGHVEYNTQFKHTKESAAYQAQQLDLKNVDNDKLFNQGLNLFDKKGDPEQERLLGMLQRGELKEDHPRYQEIRGLAEARYKVAYQKALEPPKKTSWLKQLAAVVIAAIVVYFTAGAATGWAATAIGTTAGATSVAGVAATAIGSAVGAYAGAVVGAGIQTGSLSKALAAGENSLKGGVAGILVNTALAAAGISAGNLGGSLGMSKQVGEAVYSTVTNSLTQSIAYGGSFGDALVSNALNAGVDMIAADVAGVIGKETAVGSFEKYAAHAALGCGVGMAKSGSGDGCVPAAAGAVAGHMAADGIKVALSDKTNTNPIALMAAAVPGRTLDENVVFWGGLVGGAAATLATGGKDVSNSFNLGQGTAANAITNNYLKYDELKRRDAELDACAGAADCNKKVQEKYQRLSNENDAKRTDACQQGKTQCDAVLAEGAKTWQDLQNDRKSLEARLANTTDSKEREDLTKQLQFANTNLKDWNAQRLDELWVAETRYGLSKEQQDELKLRQAATSSVAAMAAMVGGPFGERDGKAVPGGSGQAPGARGDGTRDSDGAADKLAMPAPTASVNNQGILEITPSVTTLNRQEALNTPDVGGNGKLKSAEASAAAQIEPVMGNMQRYEGPPTSGNKAPDFQIVDGPNAGKTVDLMYTTAGNSEKEIAGLNRFFEKNMTESTGPGLPPRGIEQIQDHFKKADTVVMDLRTLTPQNQNILNSYINTLPSAQQKRIVFIK